MLKFFERRTNATLIAIVFFFFFSSPKKIPFSWRVSYIIQFSLGHLDPTLIDHLSPYLSVCPIRHPLQLVVSCDSQDNTVQGSPQHKCGQKSSCNAFNAEVAVFLQIFWSLPSSQCICEVFLRGGNFVEHPYNGPSKQLNRIQQIRGGVSPRKAFLLLPRPKILVGKSQQSLISYFTSSASQVCG